MNRYPDRVEGPPIQEGLARVEYLKDRYLRTCEDDFTDTALSAKLGALSVDTLLLVPRKTPPIRTEAGAADYDISLTEIPELGAGREDSRWGVRFGQLHVGSHETIPISELVAVKYVPRTKAVRELNAARVVNERMKKRAAVTPIGFVRRHDAKVGYVSRYEHDVVTLNNVLWNPASTEAQREEALRFAGAWLANLHNHGIIHGDAQAKNIAYDSRRNPRYVDLERATDVSSGFLDPVTNRLLDVRDLFDPKYMPPTAPDEEILFVDTYLEEQKGYGGVFLGDDDVIDTIRAAREQD